MGDSLGVNRATSTNRILMYLIKFLVLSLFWYGGFDLLKQFCDEPFTGQSVFVLGAGCLMFIVGSYAWLGGK